jgi:putative permease
MKRIALYTTIVLATLLAAAVLIRYPEAVVLFLLSLSIAAATRPMVDSLAASHLPRGISVVITYLTLIAGIVLLLLLISGPLFSELARLSDTFVVTYDRIWAQWPKGSQIQQIIVRQLLPPDQLYAAITGEQGTALAQTLLGFTTSSFTTLSQIFGTFVLSIYWAIDRIHFERLWLSLLPVEIRTRWREIGRDVEQELGAYIRSELLQSLLAGIILWPVFVLLNIPYPVLLASFVAFAWFIPWLGAVLAVLAVFLSGFMAGFPQAVAAACLTILVLAVLEYFVEPRLLHRRQYSPWLTVIMIMVFGDALGLVGIIIAPPVAAISQMVARRVMQTSSVVTNPNPEIESARQIAELDERISSVQRMVDQMEEKPPVQTTSMLERLNHLIQEANGIVSNQSK